MMTRAEVIVDCACHLGEGPLWHADEKRLYWLDIRRGRVHAFTPGTGVAEVVYEGERIGGMTVQANASLLFLLPGGRIASWGVGGLRLLAEIEPDYERGRRFNDAVADARGRVYAGTYSEDVRTGRLYCIERDGRAWTVLDEVRTSNGMAFTLNGRHLYHTETRAGCIRLGEHDQVTGRLDNWRTFTEVAERDGMPDGLALDQAGYVWSARFGAGVVIRYAPDGTEVERVSLPTPRVTSIAFGGDALEDLYITTAGGGDRAGDPLAGALFRVRPSVSGAPRFLSSICL
jgi:D-xylono/L-arabinono-1,4-lactonase